MSRQMDRPVHTYSNGFAEPEFNQAPHAAAVAKALGSDHTELIVRPDVDSLLERIIVAFDEPFADSSAIPTFLVSQLASRSVKVALSGDGGDELFGGYTRYLDLMRRDHRLPAPARHALSALARRLPHSAYGRNRLLEMARSPSGRYAGMVAHALAPEEGGIASAGVVAAGHDLDSLLRRWFDDTPERDPATRASFVDLQSYLPGDILTKVDRMSMAVSLEARVPLLDHPIVEFASALPARLRFREGKGKWLLRRAIEDLVPPLVLQKPKQGFGVPLRLWFRNELRGRIDDLLRPDSAVYAYVDRAAVSRVVREHLAGRRDHSAQIWKLLVLHVWLRTPSAAQVESSPRSTFALERA
jgi:asparagine synthase (glutamine-hydrolysing)